MLKAFAIHGSFGVVNARCGGNMAAIIGFIGEGAFNKVYRAKHRGEDVAIKFPKHHHDMLTEVVALASAHPPTRASCSSLTCTAWGTRWG